MARDNRFAKAAREIIGQLLEKDSIEEALSGSLELVVKALNCEAGAFWFMDSESSRLYPVYHVGPVNISNISIDITQGTEGLVTRTGQSLIINDTASYPGYEGTVFDENDFSVRNLICVPLNNLQSIVGCLLVANREGDDGFDDEALVLCERTAALAAMTIDEKGLSINLKQSKEVLISVKDVTRDFPSGDGITTVLKGVSLDIYRGEFVVILGESGCGKSTLVNIIGGMDTLTSGSLTIEGKDFSHPSEQELTQFRRHYMGFVFQAYNLMPNLTALENVQFIADIAPSSMPAADAIAKVGLTERSNNYPAMLSGGQQQRVSIARAIVKNPKIIFADEPTAALDYQTSIEVLQVFQNIVRTQETTVVMITHNPEIAKMADRVIRLKSGRVASIRLNINPADAADLVW